MTTKKRTAANQANARRSTGPRTPEGKSRSAQNSRKHGFCAEIYSIVSIEDLQAVAKLRADLIHVYRPVNAQELFAIEEIAKAQNRMIRLAGLETGIFTACLNSAIDPYGKPMFVFDDIPGRRLEITQLQNRQYLLAEGFVRYMKIEPTLFPLFLRYQAQAERLYRRAIEDFERLKAKRPELPNEPIEEPELEETKPTPPSTEVPENPPFEARFPIYDPPKPQPDPDPPGSTSQV